MPTSQSTPPGFPAHRDSDPVAVVMRDLSPGQIEIGDLDGPVSAIAETTARIPLGHQSAPAAVVESDRVIEPGVRIAVAIRANAPGDQSHVHQVRSA